MSQPSLNDLLSVAMDAAYIAGRRTLAYFNTRIEVETKRDNTPVTQADREAESIIRDCIARHFPDHGILGEEAGETPGDKRYRWLIDPIDGTRSFIHGAPLFGTLIGVEVNGRASVGVIYLPATDQLISAADGLGCRCNGRVIRVSQVSRLEDATLLCTSESEARARSDVFEKLAGRTRVQRGWGDCFGYALVAMGKAEIMLDPVMSPWDCAPMLPILREAGGHFLTWKGEETIWGPDAIATNAALRNQVMEIVAREKRLGTQNK